jgi:hypothetical protein
MNINSRLILVILMTIAVTVSTSAAATLVWDPSTGTVEGYRVHYGTSAANPSASIDVGNTTQYSLDALSLAENTQYYFCVSAYNTAGESAPCAPVAYSPADTTPPQPPIGLIAE